MGKVVMLVPDILEKVNLIPVQEESSGNAMHYCVSPSLKELISVTPRWRGRVWGTYLIVEAPGSVEVVEVLCVRFSAPEIHISDFKIAPNCTLFGIIRAVPREKRSTLTMTQAIGSSAIVGEEIHGIVLRDVLWILLYEV